MSEEIENNARRSIKISKASIKIEAPVLAVSAIINDLCDRRGLKGEWAQIEPEIQLEIIKTWIKIIELSIEESK